MKALIAAQGVLLIGAPAAWAVRSANYGFTMEHRVVNGRDNGVMHPLEGGLIDNIGELWMTSRDGGSKEAPIPVVIEVHRDGGFFDLTLCDVAVEPDPTAKVRVPYAEACGDHPGDDYYIVAYKVEDDGWNVQAEGKIISREKPDPREIPDIIND